MHGRRNFPMIYSSCKDGFYLTFVICSYYYVLVHSLKLFPWSIHRTYLIPVWPQLMCGITQFVLLLSSHLINSVLSTLQNLLRFFGCWTSLMFNKPILHNKHLAKFLVNMTCPRFDTSSHLSWFFTVPSTVQVPSELRT